MSRLWRFGDDIDTDVLAPGRYMAAPISELASHCLEAVDPEFAGSVEPGDVIVAGTNFGMGSSREQAAQALKELGLAAVIARSFAGIFYRNAINLGLPVFTADLTHLPAGTPVAMDVAGASLTRTNTGERFELDPLPDFLLKLLNDGGLVPHLEKRFAAEKRP